MNSIKGEKHPKQLIIEHYDLLINKVDIYVEELLGKYTNKDIITNPTYLVKNISDEVERLIYKHLMKKDSDEESDNDYEKMEEDKESNDDQDAEETDDNKVNKDEKDDDDEEMMEEEEEDLNTYSYYDYDESDDDEDNQVYDDDKEAYEQKIYGGIIEFADPYDFNDESDQLLSIKEKESKKTRTYINDVRTRLIEEIRKVQSETLESYESNKDGYTFDQDNSSIEEMKEKLFGKRFCFLLDTKEIPGLDKDCFKILAQQRKHSPVFTLCAIVTDFYLNEAQLNLIKTYYERKNEKSINFDCKVNKSDYILNEKNLFLHYIAENIRYAMRANNHGIQMMSITKESLLKLTKKIEYCYINIPSVYLTQRTFPHLKSLAIRHEGYSAKHSEVEHLGGLNNLEYLEIRMMIINQRAFIGLDKLIKLVLDCCKFKKLDDKTFISQRNLQFLQINSIESNLRLHSLKNLRVLALLGLDNFKYIKTIPTESLEVLHLNTTRGEAYIDMDEIGRFFKSTNLTNLPHLRFSRNELYYIEDKWLSGLTNVKRLSLCNNMIDSVNFLNNVNLSHLTELDLYENKILSIDKNCFIGLKTLKWLNLSDNPIQVIIPGSFNGLENLETLLLKSMKKLVIEKDTFIGLSNLRILDLSYCTSGFKPKATDKCIDVEALDHAPKLECLRLKRSKLAINVNMLTRLVYLKNIVLHSSDLFYYDFDTQAGLHFKVIGN